MTKTIATTPTTYNPKKWHWLGTLLLLSSRSVTLAQPQSGQLTAADIDDNLNFQLYLAYKERMGTSLGISTTFKEGGGGGAGENTNNNNQMPNPILSDRIPIQVFDSSPTVHPYSCAMIEFENTDDPSIMTELITGTDGRLSVFPNLDSLPPLPWNIRARAISNENQGGDVMALSCPEYCSNQTRVDSSSSSNNSSSTLSSTIELKIPQNSTPPTKMDVALIIDTTGSMCDELEYIKSELGSVLNRVTSNAKDGRQIDLRVGLIVYRDTGDDYILRSFPFATREQILNDLSEQSCDGGGDYPEAMDRAMNEINNFGWRSGNVARVAFLVADAPPHDENLQATLRAAMELRRRRGGGVRVYGLAASGVANTAEYLMRMMSVVTGGRYMWLTDDSGIGGSHAEPKVLCYKVTRLDQLMGRVLRSELEGVRVEAEEEDVIKEFGKQENGVCLFFVDDQLVNGDEYMDLTDSSKSAGAGADGASDGATDESAKETSEEGEVLTKRDSERGYGGPTASGNQLFPSTLLFILVFIISSLFGLLFC